MNNTPLTKQQFENAKTPGLGINHLHSKGVTGKGVNMVIIDLALPEDYHSHKEYGHAIKSYKEILHGGTNFHGPAIASLLSGKECGVAPDANIHYFACASKKIGKKGGFTREIEAGIIEKLLDLNKKLSDEKKIRGICMPIGWAKTECTRKICEVCARAKEEGVLVVHAGPNSYKNFSLIPAGRDLNRDPDDFKSYNLNDALKGSNFIAGHHFEDIVQCKTMIPGHQKAFASHYEESGYDYGPGGHSWAIPYVIGLYALACQCNPKITPEKFFDKMAFSNDKMMMNKDGHTTIVDIVNPIKLINSVRLEAGLSPITRNHKSKNDSSKEVKIFSTPNKKKSSHVKKKSARITSAA